MRDEIQSGIRNAIERGSTLEEAIQSFISAGYNPVEVKEAANSIDPEISRIIQQNKIQASNSTVQNMTNNEPKQASVNLFTLSNPTLFGQQTQATKQKPEEKSFSQTQNNHQSVPELPKKSSKKKLVITLIVILLILILGLVGLMVFADNVL